jgi:uncharacterized protein
MIAVDTNLLVYTHREDSPFHVAAKRLIDELRVQGARWGIPWPCVHEVISVITNPRAFKEPTSLKDAFGFIDTLLVSPSLLLLSEGPGYYEKLRSVASVAKAKGGRIHDARIAALCLHHGVQELWSADRDFLLFPQLKVRNPLAKDQE